MSYFWVTLSPQQGKLFFFYFKIHKTKETGRPKITHRREIDKNCMSIEGTARGRIGNKLNNQKLKSLVWVGWGRSVMWDEEAE